MKQLINITLVAFLALLVTTAYGQQSGIDFFEGSWEEALKASKKEKKPIFVDAYAVWCGPCKWMNANVFTDDSVGQFYNENFINYKFDMERGEGPKFASEYRITAYPTLLYIDKEGAVKYRIMGARKSEDFINEGKKALDKFN